MTITINNSSLNSYDEIPYESYPYTNSRPEYLRTLGVLFGMNPPAIETARVLELGCADGGNIIPHAVMYPKGKYVGVDLSKVQIANGNTNIQKLGLKNIELKEMSIVDIDESFGEFDYIICHGVISWVPDFVRDKIFDISKKNLSKHGIAYISYNTLPGWNMVRAVRDMMLYHTQILQNPQDKVSQSRLLLEFMNECLEGSNTPYSRVLKDEMDLLAKQSDNYLRHDHLETDNFQYYFSDFMKEAYSRDLQYLADCSLSIMYLGNMPKDVSEKLKNLNDIVRTEQYMDFITNRRFRSTLLCHKDMKLNRNIDNSMIKQFTTSLNLTPEKPLSEVNLDDITSAKFYFQGNETNTLQADSPELKAILYTYAENILYPLSYDDLVKKSAAKLKFPNISKIEIELGNNLFLLVLKGYINLSLKNHDKSKINLKNPQITKLARYQSAETNSYWVTNIHHIPVTISAFDKFAMKYFDGKNDKNQVLDKLIEDCKNKIFTVSIDGKPIDDEKQIRAEIEKHLDDAINRFVQQALFV